MPGRLRHFHTSISIAFLVIGIFCVPRSVAAQEPSDSDVIVADSKISQSLIAPAPATNVHAFDAEYDHGHAINVEWTLSADDGQGQNNVLSYKILRTPGLVGPIPPDEAPEGDPEYVTFASAVYGTGTWRLVEGAWDTVGEAASGKEVFKDKGGRLRDGKDFLPDDISFRYQIVATTADGGFSASPISDPVQASGQWFHVDRLLHIGFPIAVYTILIFGFINLAQKGRKLFIRPLSGINAVDEAIGRATEMNKPILYVLGLGAADEIATIASLTILSRVAKKVAEHKTELLVPCYDPVVMTIAQETVKQAYLDAGHPDEYVEDNVYFVTQDQFPYVAAVNGTMLRRKTATNFYLGVFYAESLILAETGSLAGSIQISGTDRVTQIPFFVVACDYTLIGEELYAASAYLGREPKLLGTLKAQDSFKLIFLGFLLFGIIGAALGWKWITAMFEMTL